MNTYNNEGQYIADEIILGYSDTTTDQTENTTAEPTPKGKYGLSASAYEQLVEDCEESVEMCTYIHQFLNTNEDIQRYLF